MKTHATYLAELRENLVVIKEEKEKMNNDIKILETEKEELIAEQTIMKGQINTLGQEKDLLSSKIDAIEISIKPIEPVATK